MAFLFNGHLCFKVEMPMTDRSSLYNFPSVKLRCIAGPFMWLFFSDRETIFFQFSLSPSFFASARNMSKILLLLEKKLVLENHRSM